MQRPNKLVQTINEWWMVCVCVYVSVENTRIHTLSHKHNEQDARVA